MADFSADAISGLRMEVTKSLKDANIHVRKFDYAGRSEAGNDLMGQLDRLSSSTPQSGVQSMGLAMGGFDADFSALAAGIGKEGPEGPLLREAKALMSQARYKDADVVLRKVLQIVENHHEAIYLRAYCQHMVEEHLAALRTLLPLRGVNLSHRLGSRVESLRTQIRGVVQPLVTARYMHHVKARQYDKAAEVLDKIVDIDPAVGKYHFYLVGVSLMAGSFDKAYAALSRGLEVAESDRDELEGLRCQVELQYVGKKLRPARQYYVQSQYAAARKSLQEVDEDCKRASLWITFDRHLERLTAGSKLLSFLGGRKSPSGAAGTPEAMNALFAFIAHDELLHARQCNELQKYQDAEQWLALAVRYVPEYPLANYLYAARVYERVGGQAQAQENQKGGTAQIDAMLRELSVAQKHAKVGCADAENVQAQELAFSLTELSDKLSAVRREIEIQENDARYVNTSVDEFIKIIILMASGNMTPNKAREIVSRMESLSSSIGRNKHKVISPEAKQLMNAIEDIAGQFLRMIRQAMRSH